MSLREAEQIKTQDSKEPDIEFDLPQIKEACQYWMDRSKKRLNDTKRDGSEQHAQNIFDKFVDIQKILEEAIPAGQDPIAFINHHTERLHEKLMKTENPDLTKKIEEAIKALDDTREFILQQTRQPESSPDFVQWQREKSQEQIPQVDNNGKKKETEKELKRIREQIVMEKIKSSCVGLLYASLPKEFGNKDMDGFQSFLNEKARQQGDRQISKLLEEFSPTLDSFDSNVLASQGIREAVAINPIAWRKKGNEDFVISYEVRQSFDDYRNNGYRDYSGRGGQILKIDLEVPEEVGLEFLQYFESDPTVIRRLAKEIVIDNFEIPEETWENGKGTNGHPLKPPYGLWDESGRKRTMYFQKMDDEGEFVSEELSF